jgi:hypothetical protein
MAMFNNDDNNNKNADGFGMGCVTTVAQSSKL